MQSVHKINKYIYIYIYIYIKDKNVIMEYGKHIYGL